VPLTFLDSWFFDTEITELFFRAKRTGATNLELTKLLERNNHNTFKNLPQMLNPDDLPKSLFTEGIICLKDWLNLSS
jgi:hypothetical protein